MFREVEENRYIIRKYIRHLSIEKKINSSPVADLEQAIKFFLILHNMLKIEDRFYDLFMMQKKEINKFLHLQQAHRITEIMGVFYNLFNRGSKVRHSIETVESIEEVKLLLRENKTIYQKLQL